MTEQTTTSAIPRTTGNDDSARPPRPQAAVYVCAGLSGPASDRQLADMAAAIEERGFTPASRYLDPASAAAEAHPVFESVLRDGTRGVFDVLVVPSFLQLGADLPSLVGALSRLLAAGIDIVSLADRFDTSGRDRAALDRFVHALADFESARPSFHRQQGVATARAEGRIGRPRALDDDEVRRQMKDGRSIEEIARAMRVSRQTVWRTVKRLDAGRKKRRPSQSRLVAPFDGLLPHTVRETGDGIVEVLGRDGQRWTMTSETFARHFPGRHPRREEPQGSDRIPVRTPARRGRGRRPRPNKGKP